MTQLPKLEPANPQPSVKRQRGRPRIRTAEELAEAQRDRVQRFRADGARLDLKVSVSARRKLDAMCARCKATRNEFMEVLIRLISEESDLSAIERRVEGMRSYRDGK